MRQTAGLFGCASQLPGQLIAIHPGHHHVRRDQVDILPLHNFQRLLPVRRGNGAVASVGQHRAEKLPHIGIVLHHQNAEHPASPPVTGDYTTKM